MDSILLDNSEEEKAVVKFVMKFIKETNKNKIIITIEEDIEIMPRMKEKNTEKVTKEEDSTTQEGMTIVEETIITEIEIMTDYITFKLIKA